MTTSHLVKKGDYGITVYKLQAYLNIMQTLGFIKNKINLDGVYGNQTVKSVMEWQTYIRVQPDGIIGYTTWNTLVNQLKQQQITTNIPIANVSFYLASGQQGLAVYKMQEYINDLASKNPCLKPIPIDGVYGPRTRIAIQQYQYLSNLAIDGIIGAMTWDHIVNAYNK